MIKNRYSRRNVIRGGAGFAALAFAAACTPSQPASTGSSSSSSAPANTPKKGGIVKTVYQTEVPHLDPTTETSYASHGGPGAPFSRLIRYKTGPDVEFASRTLEPDLALTWEQPDPVTYIMKLRPDAKWHNKPPMNGRIFTADDAKWSFDFYRDASNKNVFQSMFSGIQRVEAVDKTTVKITLAGPQSFFLDNVLSSHYAKMLPPDVWEKEGNFKNTVVGTGPFMFDRWDRGVKMMYVKNPEYFEPGKPYVDGFEWALQPDYATRVSVLRAGEIDYGPEPTGAQYEDLESIKKAQPTLIWDDQLRSNLYYLALNVNAKPFNDVRVRQAVSAAIDRAEIVKTVYFGDAVTSSFMPQALTDWLLPKAEIDATFGKRDIAKAKQLLSAAGYPNGVDVEFLPRISSGAEFSLCEVVVAMLKDAGINCKMKVVTLPEWTTALNSKNYTIAEALGQTSFEPDDWTYVLYHSKSPRNQSGFNDPKLDAMLEKQRIQTVVAERKQTLLDIQRYLGEQMPMVPMMYRYEHMSHFPHLKNFKTHWSYDVTYLDKVWLDK